MVEIELSPRRRVGRRRHHTGVALSFVIGVLAAGSLVAVLAPLLDQQGAPYAFVPPGVPGSTAAEEEREGDVVSEPSGSPDRSTGAADARGPEVVTPTQVSAPEPASVLAPGGDPAVGLVLDVDDEPGSGADPDERRQISGALSRAERVLLAALGVAAPATVPVAEHLLHTTNAVLDSVEDGVIGPPIRLGSVSSSR